MFDDHSRYVTSSESNDTECEVVQLQSVQQQQQQHTTTASRTIPKHRRTYPMPTTTSTTNSPRINTTTTNNNTNSIRNKKIMDTPYHRIVEDDENNNNNSSDVLCCCTPTTTAATTTITSSSSSRNVSPAILMMTTNTVVRNDNNSSNNDDDDYDYDDDYDDDNIDEDDDDDLLRSRRGRRRRRRSTRSYITILLYKWYQTYIHECIQRQIQVYTSIRVMNHSLSSSNNNTTNTTLLLHDLFAGCMVGIMIVPQSMSYAKLASLPIEYGLYSSFIPLYIYAFYGMIVTTIQKHPSSSLSLMHSILAVGPVALVSLLLSSGIHSIMKDLYPNLMESDTQTIDNTTTTTVRNEEEYQSIYEHLTIQCTMMVGILNILFGTIQYRSYTMGTIIMNCLSHTVLSSFTTGAAMIIALSQCKYIMGVSLGTKTDTIPTILYGLYEKRHQMNTSTVYMGCISLIILLLAKYIQQHATVSSSSSSSSSSKALLQQYYIKYCIMIIPLFVVILSVLCTRYFQLYTIPYNIAIVGHIPQGLPHTSISYLLSFISLSSSASKTNSTIRIVLKLIPVAIRISIISFIETIAISKQLQFKQEQDRQRAYQDQRQRQLEQQQQQQDQNSNNHMNIEENDNNSNNNADSGTNDNSTNQLSSSKHELLALGLANIVGSCFYCYPIAGSFSRSAINYNCSAKTRYAGCITATIVGGALLLITSFFESLPYNILASIVITGVIGLLDFNEAIELWFTKKLKLECLVWILCCFGTMCFGCEYGLLIGIISSLSISLYKTTFVPITVLKEIPNTSRSSNDSNTSFSNDETMLQESQLLVKNTIITSFNGPIIYFGNIHHIVHMMKSFINIYFDEQQRIRDTNNNNNNTLLFTTSNSVIIESTSTMTSTLLLLNIVIDMSCIVYIDPYALHQLKSFLSTIMTSSLSMNNNIPFNNQNQFAIRFYVTNVIESIQEQLVATGHFIEYSEYIRSTTSITSSNLNHCMICPSMQDTIHLIHSLQQQI